MSVGKVRAFFEKVAKDKNLQNELKAVAEREEAAYADLVKIASAAGFKFTTADVRKARVAASRGEQLTEDELAAVAGGTGTAMACTCGSWFFVRHN